MVNLNVQAKFPDDPSKPDLGAMCHQQADGQVPVCVITDIKNNILLTNQPGDHSDWVVTRSRVNVTRMWTSSTALIKCTCQILDPAEISPPLTKIPPFRPVSVNSPRITDEQKQDNDLKKGNINTISKDGDLLYPLGIGDEIRIFLGYIDSISDSITPDMLGIRLLCTFVGCIDIVTEVSSSSDGLSVTLECRDRLKYITDSYSSFSADDLTETILGSTQGTRQSNRLDGVTNRPSLILTLAQRAVGDFTGDTACSYANCGYQINKGEIFHDPDTDSYTELLNDSDSRLQSKLKAYVKDTATVVKGFPDFNILSTRLGFSKESPDIKPPTISERIAIETIKFLSLQENQHTEVFCHHVDGDLYYVPRINDSSGLKARDTFYRTYFNRISPPGFSQLYGETWENEILHPCQKIILYREEQTLLSTKSNILVKSSKDSQEEMQKYVFSVKSVIPRFQTDRAFPCSYFSIFDDSLSTALDYISVGLQFARRVSKEVRACSIHLIGDPSLSPSEIIQIITASCNSSNTFYKQDDTNKIKKLTPKDILQSALQDREDYKTYYEEYKKINEFFVTKRPDYTSINSGGDTQVKGLPIDKTQQQTSGSEGSISFNVSQIQSTTESTFCERIPNSGTDSTTATSTNINTSNFKPDPPSIFRIEALTHRFNDGKLGYYTELALLSPF